MNTWDRFRYFRPSEFDSPDAPGSGVNMNLNLIALLDEARHIAGVPFRISEGGGYRTKDYNAALVKRNVHASRRSLHMTGQAADIVVLNGDAKTRAIILAALMEAGIERLGIANTFIHVDVGGPDTDRRTPAVWLY